MPSAV